MMFFLVTGLVFVTTGICFPHYVWITFSFPVILAIPITITIAMIIAVQQPRRAKVFSWIAVTLHTFLLLIGVELLKSPGTTWGNSAVYVGIFLVVHTLLTLQLATYLYSINLFVGIHKLIGGIIILFMLKIADFPSSEWIGELEEFLRNGIPSIAGWLIGESIFLILYATTQKITGIPEKSGIITS